MPGEVLGIAPTSAWGGTQGIGDSPNEGPTVLAIAPTSAWERTHDIGDSSRVAGEGPNKKKARLRYIRNRKERGRGSMRRVVRKPRARPEIAGFLSPAGRVYTPYPRQKARFILHLLVREGPQNFKMDPASRLPHPTPSPTLALGASGTA